MEENHIPTPTGIAPAPAPIHREDSPEPLQAPEQKTDSAPETEPVAETQATDEETCDKYDRNDSLRDVDPNLVIVCGSLLGATLPLMNVILPFILWLLWKEKDPQIDQTGKSVLNVQLTAVMWIIISGLLTFAWIGLLLLPLAILGWAFATIGHCLKTSSGDYDWLPPGTIPFIK